jgi:UrcA family protein
MFIAMKKNLSTVIATAAIAASGVCVAAADASFESHSAMVRFADLDTSGEQGAAALYERIERAARIVCRDLEPDGQLSRYASYTRCVHEAIKNAIEKIDRPAVTAYGLARGLFRRSADGRLVLDR